MSTLATGSVGVAVLLAVMAVNVGFDHRLEFLGDPVPLEGDRLDAILVDRCHRIFTSSREADADVGMLALTRSIHHTPHHRNLHVFNTVIALLPFRHFVTNMALNILSELLEVGAGGPAAARASGNQWQK